MKELTQKQKGMLILIGVFVMILVLVLALLPKSTEEREDGDGQKVQQTIPDPEAVTSPDSKSDGYRRSTDISDYWNSLASDEDSEDAGDGEDPGSSGKESGRPRVQTVEELFGPTEVPQSPAPRRPSGGGSGAAPRKSVEPVPETPPDDLPATKAETYEDVRVKRSGAVSSLDEDVVQDLGNGFSSLDAADSYIRSDEGHPYKCMFTRSEKVHTGQRISVRLLEDMIICGTLIPQNTHLSAVCTITTRMEVVISSIEFRGRILTFKLEGYDTDGGKGIYCSDLGEGKRRATEQGISTVTSTLGSRLGKIAGDATNVGASIIRSKTGEVTVEIPAGYVFYVIESRDRY